MYSNKIKKIYVHGYIKIQKETIPNEFPQQHVRGFIYFILLNTCQRPPRSITSVTIHLSDLNSNFYLISGLHMALRVCKRRDTLANLLATWGQEGLIKKQKIQVNFFKKAKVFTAGCEVT